MAKQELVATIRDRYQQSLKKEKGRILDEFTAITGHHRKHGIRLLRQPAGEERKQVVGRRIYDEAVREAVIVVWEASDRICGKRLRAALPNLVDSMERHGHLELDPEVRSRLLSASAATLDRLLKPIRSTAGSRRRRRRRPSMGRQIPVRTFNDWNRPPPGFLEIDLVAHCGGSLSGSFVHILVATDICTDWTEAVPLLGREQSLVVEGLEAIARQLPFVSSASTRTMTAPSSTRPWCSTALSGELNSPGPGPTARTPRPGSSRRTGPSSDGSQGTTATRVGLPDRSWSTSIRRCVCT